MKRLAAVLAAVFAHTLDRDLGAEREVGRAGESALLGDFEAGGCDAIRLAALVGRSRIGGSIDGELAFRKGSPETGLLLLPASEDLVLMSHGFRKGGYGRLFSAEGPFQEEGVVEEVILGVRRNEREFRGKGRGFGIIRSGIQEYQADDDPSGEESLLKTHRLPLRISHHAS